MTTMDPSVTLEPRPFTPSEKIAYISQENMGGTFHSTGEPVTHECGYWVSRTGTEITEKLTPALVFSFIEKHNLVDSFYYVGTWYSGKDWHLDRSVWFGDKDLALESARENKQLAIWDIEKSEEILVEVPVPAVKVGE